MFNHSDFSFSFKSMAIKDYFLQGIFTKHDGQLETLHRQLHWVLRISVALCFIGHGTWGIITKAGWLPFFASQGIPLDLAWNLQPLIGAFDILMAFLILWKPRRIILFWMFLWALWTAALRPLSGNLEKFQVDGEWLVRLATDSMNVAKMQTWEFWERAGNWGPPLMLLLMGGTFAMKAKDWFSEYTEPRLKESMVDTIFFLLRVTLALLLIGHAGFGFAVEKQMLIDHWQSIGIDANVDFIRMIGWYELGLGVFVFIFPIRSIVWLCLVWKLFTEFLYVPADTVAGMGWVNIFETIERFGDYGVPLAILYIISYRQVNPDAGKNCTID
ncbi:MAG: hypothetical protein VXZ45_03300 [Verrucomicrobiota bacterium]|nr:hypothetical protein [Verrucomicrobiota bacterium]